MKVNRATAEMYAAWFRCLADPTRIIILNLLARRRRPLTVGQIVAAVDVGQSTVSHHLKVLAETGFVLAEPRGAATLYAVNERCLDCFPSAAELVMGKVPLARKQSTRRVAPWLAEPAA